MASIEDYIDWDYETNVTNEKDDALGALDDNEKKATIDRTSTTRGDGIDDEKHLHRHREPSPVMIDDGGKETRAGTCVSRNRHRKGSSSGGSIHDDEKKSSKSRTFSATSGANLSIPPHPPAPLTTSSKPTKRSASSRRRRSGENRSGSSTSLWRLFWRWCTSCSPWIRRSRSTRG